MSGDKGKRIGIIPLSDQDPKGLGGIFKAQCKEWLDLFRWDYTKPSATLEEALKRHQLPGFVALSEGVPVGIIYYIIHDDEASLGDIYIAPHWRATIAAALLVRKALEEIEGRANGLHRIECQCLTIGLSGVDEIFLEFGFRRFNRLFLSRCLKESSGCVAPKYVSGAVNTQDGIRTRPWKDIDYYTAAKVIQRSHSGTQDCFINSDYRTEAGCAGILGMVTDSLWCGRFLPQVSRSAEIVSTGELIGLLLGSVLAPGAGHIVQVSVLPEYQGRGIGRRLLMESLMEFEEGGFDTVSLVVTESNSSAVHLYNSFGFERIHDYRVYSREMR